MSLFDRAIAITDLHLGNKSNSHIFNQDCLDFIEWTCEVGQREGISTLLFLGDWHHHRSSINVATLNYSIRALEKLNSAFDNVHVIPGNHDEYYRDNRSYNSIEFIRRYPNVHFYNDITTVDGCTFVPWLIGDEYRQMRKLKSDYVFGHFELPSFFMNARVQMPDHGELQRVHFQDCGTVFTGHFHKRQESGNIVYMGNAFPHNYSDVWDDERGLAIIDWNAGHEYHAWPGAPKYRNAKISDLLANPDHYLGENTYARISLDIEINYEEANYIKETFVSQYQLRELSLIPAKLEEHEFSNDGEIVFESVDSIVQNQLSQISSEAYSRDILLDIYRHL